MATVLVTGANRGIGLEFCRQFNERGDEVIATCRNPGDELNALGVRVEGDVDVTDVSSLVMLANNLVGTSIDILVNNAGIMYNENVGDMDFDSIRQQFEVNALGALHTVDTLLPLLANPSKIALITSRMGSIADNTSGGKYGYRMSKCALNMAGVSLAQDLKDRGIAVAILHPGYVKTDMTGNNGNVTPEESVRDLIKRIDELNIDNSGTFWHANGEVLPW
ncbi:MAG: SDR family oxidoreductase [Gammaproteobacteria bacterium]|nr:SDR family oxidoreductase [Gammaproteobacteria bacterium]